LPSIESTRPLFSKKPVWIGSDVGEERPDAEHQPGDVQGQIGDLLAEPDGVVQVIVIQPLDPAGQDQVLGDGVNPAQEDLVEALEPKIP
jgi:hypothetical protein